MAAAEVKFLAPSSSCKAALSTSLKLPEHPTETGSANRYTLQWDGEEPREFFLH